MNPWPCLQLLTEIGESWPRALPAACLLLLASLVFEDGGVVFGCAYSSDMRPRHVCVEDPGDLRKLQGSKYVQSDIGMSYAEARRYLDEGRRVLFTVHPVRLLD